ncbi:class I SAM-dependent methyltransferase [Candidatus Binatia bacterium]|nr:class I SAM-dependent methyltransferase [Candidatus Binatia bacterium]
MQSFDQNCPVSFYDERSAEYAAAFATLLRSDPDGTRELLRMLHAVIGARPRTTRCVDWGAGTGRLTRELCTRFDTVYAVEPSDVMHPLLAQGAPSAVRITGSLGKVELPERCGIAVLSHVLYHVPDHLWGPLIVHAARQLTDDGVLMVALKHPDTGCNAMLESFGAERFDLYRIAATLRHHPELSLEMRSAPGRLVTGSLDETLEVARFMLCDRTPAGFSRLPTEREFEEYVREVFWDEARGRGGWNLEQVFALVRPNPAWTR